MGGVAAGATMKRTRPRPGDLFAIPRDQGGYYFVVHVASNQFGEAFGILAGHYEAPMLPNGWIAVPIRHAVYTGKALVANGRWKCFANRQDVLRLFPQTPEIFHAKSDNQTDPCIGPFGSGEKPSGQLREIGEAEAKDLGLGRDYRQIMVEEQFERFVRASLG